IGIKLEIPASRGNAIAQHAQLPAADGREHVAHPVVVADFRMLVMRRRVARLRGELERVRHQPRVIAHEHPSATRGDDLVPVEREYARTAEGADGATPVGGAERFGGVLDERDLVASAGRDDGIEVRALPIQVHEYHGRGQATNARTPLELFGQKRWVHVPGLALAVYEYGRAAQVENRVHARGEGERTHEHFRPGRDSHEL